MTRRMLLVLSAVLPALLGVKCFDPQAAVELDASGPPADSGPDAAAFVPAVACPTVGDARLKVIDHSYQVQCGCLEASGKTCTVPHGTRVIWQFVDSEEHNVSSDGDSFGSSPDELAGTFGFRFDVPGTYRYGCTIHTEMTGYAIVVE